jgi:hypothetical protein
MSTKQATRTTKTSKAAVRRTGAKAKTKPAAGNVKQWTVMVYMAGDNSLDPEGVQDLKEMKQVGSTDQVNVIAEFDRAAGHAAWRYYVRKGGVVTGDAVA